MLLVVVWVVLSSCLFLLFFVFRLMLCGDLCVYLDWLDLYLRALCVVLI